MLPRHILVALDFSAPSEQALGLAIELAGKLDARLTLLHVVHPPTFSAGPESFQGNYATETGLSRVFAACSVMPHQGICGDVRRRRPGVSE